MAGADSAAGPLKRLDDWSLMEAAATATSPYWCRRGDGRRGGGLSACRPFFFGAIQSSVPCRRVPTDPWRGPRSCAELANLEEIGLATKPEPGDLPYLRGVEVHGISLPLLRAIGGDHLIYLDFKQRYDPGAPASRGGSGGAGRRSLPACESAGSGRESWSPTSPGTR